MPSTGCEQPTTQAAPNVPGCTCDRDDDSNEDGPIILCPKHEEMLRPLRWDTLASMVVDLGAAAESRAEAVASLTAQLEQERSEVDRLREALTRIIYAAYLQPFETAEASLWAVVTDPELMRYRTPAPKEPTDA